MRVACYSRADYVTLRIMLKRENFPVAPTQMDAALLLDGDRLLASHAEGFPLRVLLKPCVNLSIHTASDVRLPTLKTRQWGKSVGLTRRTRANHCFAPLERPRRRLNFRRAQRIR